MKILIIAGSRAKFLDFDFNIKIFFLKTGYIFYLGQKNHNSGKNKAFGIYMSLQK
jgi:hypothetical protein